MNIFEQGNVLLDWSGVITSVRIMMLILVDPFKRSHYLDSKMSVSDVILYRYALRVSVTPLLNLGSCYMSWYSYDISSRSKKVDNILLFKGIKHSIVNVCSNPLLHTWSLKGSKSLVDPGGSVTSTTRNFWALGSDLPSDSDPCYRQRCVLWFIVKFSALYFRFLGKIDVFYCTAWLYQLSKDGFLTAEPSSLLERVHLLLMLGLSKCFPGTSLMC